MDNTPPRTRRLKGWNLSKKLSTFSKNTSKYMLDSYCDTIDNTIYAYVKNFHTCSGIFSFSMDNAGTSRSGIYDVYFSLPPKIFQITCY